MSRVHLALLVVVATAYCAQAHLQKFNRCQLSRELLRYNFPRGLITNWVCMIEHASGRQTDKITYHNNSYTSYGLFQIHSKDWCKVGRKGGHCNMKCEDLLNADLADDVRCAKRIYDRVGFKAWPSSYSYCKDKTLPDLAKC